MTMDDVVAIILDLFDDRAKLSVMRILGQTELTHQQLLEKVPEEIRERFDDIIKYLDHKALIENVFVKGTRIEDVKNFYRLISIRNKLLDICDDEIK
jgi:hypothetical protein